MKPTVFDIITDCIRNNPKGGEQFFEELDENLRDTCVLKEFLYTVPRCFNNVVCSVKSLYRYYAYAHVGGIGSGSR